MSSRDDSIEHLGPEETSGGPEESSFIEYGIDDKPPLFESMFLGFQHYLTMIGATVARRNIDR